MHEEDKLKLKDTLKRLEDENLRLRLWLSRQEDLYRAISQQLPKIEHKNCNCTDGYHYNNGDEVNGLGFPCEKCDYWEKLDKGEK